MQAVKVDANRSNRSLTGGQPDGAASLRARRVVLADRTLLWYRRQIDFTVADAKRTRCGLPSDLAIEARYWINDFRPPRTDRSRFGQAEYWRSFPCCCEMLGLDVDAERKRLIAEIDDFAVKAMVRYFGNAMYERRARVLACSGVPTAVSKQFVLGLVDPADYEDVADPEDARRLAAVLQRERKAAARVAAKRAKRLRATGQKAV